MTLAERLVNAVEMTCTVFAIFLLAFMMIFGYFSIQHMAHEIYSDYVFDTEAIRTQCTVVKNHYGKDCETWVVHYPLRDELFAEATIEANKHWNSRDMGYTRYVGETYPCWRGVYDHMNVHWSMPGIDCDYYVGGVVLLLIMFVAFEIFPLMAILYALMECTFQVGPIVDYHID